jgi:hypothetical protein
VEFWQALLLALVPSVAAIITAMVAFRDLGLRRRLETSRQFLALFSLAHGRLDSGRTVGVGEQVATIHLIADFALREKVVRNAAREGLRYLASWRSSPVTANDLLASLGDDVPEAQRLAVAEAAAREVNRKNEASNQIADAASGALKRLP